MKCWCFMLREYLPATPQFCVKLWKYEILSIDLRYYFRQFTTEKFFLITEGCLLWFYADIRMAEVVSHEIPGQHFEISKYSDEVRVYLICIRCYNINCIHWWVVQMFILYETFVLLIPLIKFGIKWRNCGQTFHIQICALKEGGFEHRCHFKRKVITHSHHHEMRIICMRRHIGLEAGAGPLKRWHRP